MLKTCRLAEKNGYKVFLLGGSSGQSGQLRQELKKKLPGLRVAGNHDTPARPIPEKDNAVIVKKINQSGAQVVFVGMGCPTQELWMMENRDKLNAPALIGVGAAFDFLSGRVRQAPEWMQNVGLEWLYRLIQEPKRLWYRYTVINARFLFLVVGEVFRKKFLLRP
jgi:N-acetylglucosaminyldiphosphoundecaprenol N-acetyl-beta-D-mannosaminyltransferase